ncbi:type II toxin-antitoxin system Phd/YefM family antitoxin [Corynebacterium aquatimens]|uniref:Prevent-host-death family protein n=1 Tax=Corynebacterium aquatimens TaxID=1190508 RepID=A0A931DX02_9CORY|nr:prevent-host-death family protein [Corynebacterium aquatimens]
MTAIPVPQGQPDAVRHIPQRELRNDSSRVLREVADGAEFIITTRGTPVARLSPIGLPAYSQLTYSPPSRPQTFSTEGLDVADDSVREFYRDYRDDRF